LTQHGAPLSSKTTTSTTTTLQEKAQREGRGAEGVRTEAFRLCVYAGGGEGGLSALRSKITSTTAIL